MSVSNFNLEYNITQLLYAIIAHFERHIIFYTIFDIMSFYFIYKTVQLIQIYKVIPYYKRKFPTNIVSLKNHIKQDFRNVHSIITYSLFLNIPQYNNKNIPYGKWYPNRELQRNNIPPYINLAQIEWMLVSKRLNVSKDIALMITSYICTESGWI